MGHGMKKGLFVKGKVIKKALFCACFAMSMMMFTTSVNAQTRLYTSTSDKADNFEYYEGKVTSGVNIRIDAGADKDKVMVGGKGVSLAKGTIVTIIGSKNVGNKPWYKIRFTYGGKELEGFATSTYIQKTGVVITPTPTPTAEPTPEPTIAPEPTVSEVTVNPTIAPVVETEETAKSQGNDKMMQYVVIAIAVLTVAGGGIYLYLRKKDGGTKAVPASKKAANQKEVTLKSKEDHKLADSQSENSDNDLSLEVKKQQVGRVSKRDKILRQTNLKSEVYVIKSKEENAFKDLGLAATLEAIDLEEHIVDKQHNPVQQESLEKKALRDAINNLKQHDIILHKYFGKGEVYDNSDVRLIEVRFGSDARFLNKDQLVNKKLIHITNEKAKS